MTETIGPDPIDLHVGARIRMRRKERGMSQTALGEAIGVTFQQLQKYELGTNRISASKLYRTALTLQVPVQYFFEGMGDPDMPDAEAETSVYRLLMTPQGVEMARAFAALASSKQRRLVVELLRSMTEGG